MGQGLYGSAKTTPGEEPPGGAPPTANWTGAVLGAPPEGGRYGAAPVAMI